ncbi:hypothetical protein [Actinospica robiniae]|uniref:hypothetical protein n=1 Tax=Actinospica robiniae TaxID=304901 RepID=UPI000425CF92|nr:hypothetical protein [Actinospica robiniae]
MLIIPMDNSRTLLAVGPATPQMDRANVGQPAVDRATGAPLMDVPLVMPTDDGQPLTMRVTVPVTGMAEEVKMGSMVKATGLTLVTDVKNGKAWYMYRAAALSLVKG